MAWRDELQDGSFRGVPFLIDSHEAGGGRRTTTHEYPLRDEPFTEDMGRKAREFSVECFVLGQDYMVARDALLDALEAEGPGTLVHPYRGSRWVSVRDYRQRENTGEGGRATFSITFSEAGSPGEPDTIPDTAGAVDAAADDALAGTEADFAESFTVEAQPAFVAESATGLLSSAASNLRKISGQISSALSPISEFAAQADAFGAALGNLIRLPAALAADVVGLVVAVAGVATDVRAALGAYQSLWPFGNDEPDVPTTTSTRRQQADNQTAIANLMQRAATIEASRAASRLDFASSADAAALRDALADQFDTLMAAPMSDSLFAALMDLRAAMVRDLAARGLRLPRTEYVTLGATLPALVVAYRVHGDAARSDELVARNRVRHPGFVPGGVPLEVLTDVA